MRIINQLEDPLVLWAAEFRAGEVTVRAKVTKTYNSAGRAGNIDRIPPPAGVSGECP